MNNEEQILLVKQDHKADKAGRHTDWRIVVGDKAYSWATRKDAPGKLDKLILHEQPVHDRAYATSKKVVIPKGQYGAGVTDLVYAQKGKAKYKLNDYFELNLNNGDRYYIKKMPSYGDKAWLLVNLTGIKPKEQIEKASSDSSELGSEQEDIYPQPDATETKIAIRNVRPMELAPSKGKAKTTKELLQRISLEKTAAAKKKEKEPDVVEPQLMADEKHQARVLEKLKTDHPRLIAFHGLGSGKTRTALRAIQEAQKKYPKEMVTYVAPASLIKNVEKERKKHKIILNKKNLKVLSYEMAVRKKEELGERQHSLMVLDEAHKLRDEDTQRVKELKDILNKSRQLLMLSGSPIYNKPTNLATMVNLAAGKKVLPQEDREFDKEFIKKTKLDPGFMKRMFLGVKPGTKLELKNQNKLQGILKQYVDYYEPDEKAKAFYPKVTEEEVRVPMSKKQEEMYHYVEGKMPGYLKWKIRMGLPPDKRELKDLNSFASGLRQVSNSDGPYRHKGADDEAISPKIETAVSRLLTQMNGDKNFKGLVYSNYLGSGLHPYSAALKKAGVPHALYSGELSAKEKQKLVDGYNKGKIRALLVSSAGGEGLDLKGTKLTQILEPHFNKSKIDQVVGRGSRYMSHMHLPKEERNMKVEHYLSTMKQGLVDKLFKIQPKSIDEYLRNRSSEKDQFNQKIKELVAQGTNQ